MERALTYGFPFGFPGMLRRAGERFYSDFLLPSRLEEYRTLLGRAVDAGFAVHSVASFWEMAKQGGVDPAGRHLVLRHDVDTDAQTARAIWEIELEMGLRSTFYFRLSTLDVALMKSIAAAGGEASYHYEELATVAKEEGLHRADDVRARFGQIRARFARNLHALRQLTGLPMHTVASHGDFANRRLGMANWQILTDEDFRRQVGVELETYDECFMRHVGTRCSDAPAPRYWEPHSPAEALQQAGVLYLLTHPRHWRANLLENAMDDLNRMREPVLYWIRGRLRRSGRTLG